MAGRSANPERKGREKLNEARSVFDQALKIDPNDPDALGWQRLYLHVRLCLTDGRTPKRTTTRKYSVRPTGPLRSPPITGGPMPRSALIPMASAD